MLRFTDQGRKTIKDSPRRVREAKVALEKSGIKVIQILYATGRYDLVVITESPNDQAMLAAVFATILAGNASFETLHAYTVEEIDQIVSKLP